MVRIMVLCFFSICMLSFKDASNNVIGIMDALKNGSVKMTITGKGGHSGNCITASISNKSGKRLSVDIPPGLVLHPSDSTMQDLLLVDRRSIELKPSESKSVALTAYCCRYTKRSPSEGIQFKMAEVKNQNLIKIADYIDKHNFSEESIQGAVWSVSDQKSISEIYGEGNDSVKFLRKEVAAITGLKDDWYSVKSNYTVDDRGYIQSSPVLVTGNITLKNDKPQQLKQEVCKENGEVVWTPKGAMELPKSGNITFNFKLTVTGWEPGNYFVRISVPGRVILKQEFRI